VGHHDELIAEPKGADDLGGGRKKGNDAHENPSVGRTVVAVRSSTEPAPSAENRQSLPEA